MTLTPIVIKSFELEGTVAINAKISLAFENKAAFQ